MWPCRLFNQVHDVARRVWFSQAARVAGELFDLLGLVQERKNFGSEAPGGQLWFDDQPRRLRFDHFLRVAKLMAVRRAPEGDKDGGASGGSDFRRSDGACPANNRICPGKAFRHVRKKRNYLRYKFAPRIRSAYRIIVAFAGLVHNAQFGFARGEAVHGVRDAAIDGQSALAAAGDEEAEGFFRFARSNLKKLGADRIAGEDSFFAKFFRGDGIAGGDTARHARENFVREARFGVRFENDVRDAAKPGSKEHGARRVTADAECRDRFVLANDRKSISHTGKKRGEIFDEREAALALESGGAQCFERQGGLRDKLHFNSALCSYEHDFSFGSARKPFAGDCNRRKNVATRASACNQELHGAANFTRTPLAAKYSGARLWPRALRANSNRRS